MTPAQKKLIYLRPDLGFQHHAPREEPGLPGEMAEPRTGARARCNMSVEHLVVPASEEVLKKPKTMQWEYFRRTQKQSRAPTGQSWKDSSHKIKIQNYIQL